MNDSERALRVGIGGPVGSGKTALVDALCKRMRDQHAVAVVTNDIYTREDAEFLTRSQALAPERIVGVETGGCPHTAIREDASINLAAVAELGQRLAPLDLIFIESGGDNLAATFSPGAGVYPEVLFDGVTLRPELVNITQDGVLSLVTTEVEVPLVSMSLFGRVYQEDPDLPDHYCPV